MFDDLIKEKPNKENSDDKPISGRSVKPGIYTQEYDNHTHAIPDKRTQGKNPGPQIKIIDLTDILRKRYSNKKKLNDDAKKALDGEKENDDGDQEEGVPGHSPYIPTGKPEAYESIYTTRMKDIYPFIERRNNWNICLPSRSFQRI